MFRFSLGLSLLVLATPCFADVSLPPVNPSRTVSALDLYGVVPESKPVQRQLAKSDNNASKLLVPRRPADDLWSNGDAPLRMPDESEYSVRKADFVLPEETLDDGNRFTEQRVVRAEPEKQIVARPRAEEEFIAQQAAPKIKPTVIRSVPAVQSRRSAVPEPASAPVSQDRSKNEEQFAYNGNVPLSKLSPSELKRAFKKTFTVENKHLSSYEIDDGTDEVETVQVEGFDSSRTLSEQSGGVRPLEIKIGFDDDNSALSRDNYNLLTEYASIVATSPKRAVQISISERNTRSYDGRKLAARRLAIIEQVLKDSGIVDRRIIPVLSQRNDDAFVLRVISSDVYNTLSEQKRDMFGDTIASKSYKSMSW